jgi:hypothetical protein
VQQSCQDPGAFELIIEQLYRQKNGRERDVVGMKNQVNSKKIRLLVA